MSARLGERLRGMLCSVGALFRAPYSGADAESRPVLRGNMRRAIVIKTPDDMFAEAVFILRDDYDPASPRGTAASGEERCRGTRSARAPAAPVYGTSADGGVCAWRFRRGADAVDIRSVVAYCSAAAEHLCAACGYVIMNICKNKKIPVSRRNIQCSLSLTQARPMP